MWKVYDSGKLAMINAQKVWSAAVCFLVTIAQLLLTKIADLITLLNLEVLNVTVLRNVTPCSLLNVSGLFTLHRTDCCSYIFIARWSRGQRVSSKLATHPTKYPQSRENHNHCCGELKTYICIWLSYYCLDVSKRRRVRVVLWCLPYWTLLRSFLALVRYSKSSRNLCFRNFSTDIRD